MGTNDLAADLQHKVRSAEAAETTATLVGMAWKSTFKSQHGRSPTPEDREARKVQKRARQKEPVGPSRVTLTVQRTNLDKVNGGTQYVPMVGPTVKRDMFVSISGFTPTTTLEHIRGKISTFWGGVPPLRPLVASHHCVLG